jgi:adenine deaminase
MPKTPRLVSKDRKRKLARLEAALGKRPCDTVFRNITYFDAFNCRWVAGDVSVFEGAVVGLDSGLRAKREVRGKGLFLVPGFIDAHVHVESSLMSPFEFQKAVLSKGTTTAISDPHELANVQGVSGIQYFLNASLKLELDLRVMLSSCVPATTFETNGGGEISAAALKKLMGHPQVLGLAEMMNVPGVLTGEKKVWDKIEAFEMGRIDGHCPMLRGHELSAYAASGISSCHESTQWEEAQEKLTKGMAVWIREGSVAKDLKALAPLLNLSSSPCIGFCTDDRNPLDIATEGHIDHLVRAAIRQGVPMEAVYRSSAWSVARHYGLRGIGAIAPGYRADFVLLSDREACGIEQVWSAGRPIEELEFPSASRQAKRNSIRAAVPLPKELEGPQGRVHVIGVQPGKILTSREVADSRAPGIAKLTVLERYGHGLPPANAYVKGFGENFKGAIASSVGHDSHNLIVVGSSTEDMAVALKALVKSGGGYCVVVDREVKAHLALPVGGLMTELSATEIAQSLRLLRKACREQNCLLEEPFLQLAFLSLPVIPSLKLTDQGLFDVDAFRRIEVRAV